MQCANPVTRSFVCLSDTIFFSAVRHGGGVVPCVRFAVLRRYPLLYLDSSEGSRTVLNAKGESEFTRSFEAKREARMQAVYAEAMQQEENEEKCE